MSLDELDAAFQDGRVDVNTLVKPPDAKLWTRLGPLAGLDETPPPWSAGPSANVEIDIEVDLGDMPSAPRPKGRIVAAAAAVVATLGVVAFIASGESPVVNVASKSVANALVVATPLPPPAPAPVVAALAAPATAQPAADPPPPSKVKTKTKKTRDKSTHAASKRGAKT